MFTFLNFEKVKPFKEYLELWMNNLVDVERKGTKRQRQE